MTDDDLQDADTLDDTSRRDRLEGAIHCALSELEQNYQLPADELALAVTRAMMGRIAKKQGEFAYFDFVKDQLSIFSEQDEILTGIFEKERIKALN